MLKPTLNSLAILDFILILEFIVINSFFDLTNAKEKMGEAGHEVPTFLRLRWALAYQAPCFFHESSKIS